MRRGKQEEKKKGDVHRIIDDPQVKNDPQVKSRKTVQRLTTVNTTSALQTDLTDEDDNESFAAVAGDNTDGYTL